MFHAKPSFLIIGAQKAATSSLYTYLIQHPNIVPPKEKEVNYFNIDSNFNQGVSWYHKKFNGFVNPFKTHLTFEATPEYLYIPSVPNRIKEYKKDMKFIIVFREPAERAYSSWNMFKKLHSLKKVPSVLDNPYITNIPNNLKTILFGNTYPTFEEVLDIEKKYMEDGVGFLEPSFIRRGMYHDQIERYLTHFDYNQFLFLEHRDISENLKVTLNKILAFIGLDKYNWGGLNQEIANKGNYEVKTPPILNELKEFYRPHNELLFKTINQEFDWNKK